MPKSRIFTTSSLAAALPGWPRVSITLAGFRSRCTTPWAWAWASACSICRTMSSARPTGSRRASWMASASECPGTYSITRKNSPVAARPKSVTAMMLGWFRRLEDWASRSKRRTASSTWPSSPCSSLMATVFFISVCSAR